MIYNQFMERKERVEQSRRTLTLKLEEMRKPNKVRGVGRTPHVVVLLLQVMEKAGIAEQYLTVGIHALYAFEPRVACASVLQRWRHEMSICSTTPANTWHP